MWMIFSHRLLATITILGLRTRRTRVSGASLTFIAVTSRDACMRSCVEYLFRTRDFCSLPACAVHFMGRFRGLADTLAPDSSLAACRFSCVGNPYGTASLAVSSDPAGELARRQRRSRARPGRVSCSTTWTSLVYPDISSTMLTIAAVIICALKSCVLWTAGLDRGEDRTIVVPGCFLLRIDFSRSARHSTKKKRRDV